MIIVQLNLAFWHINATLLNTRIRMFPNYFYFCKVYKIGLDNIVTLSFEQVIYSVPLSLARPEGTLIMR